QLPRVLRLTLADAVDLAVQNNLDLVLAQLEEDGLRLDYLSTWGSFDPLLESGLNYVDAETPQAFSGLAGDVPVVNQKFTSLSSSLSQLLTTGGRVTLSGQYSTTETNNAFAEFGEFSESSLTLGFAQPLLRNAWRGATLAPQRTAEIAWRRQVQTKREQLEQLLQDVQNAYWDLVAALELQKVRELTLAQSKRQLEINRETLRVGTGTEVDLLQAETSVATNEQDLLEARNTALDRMDDLRRLLFRRDGSSDVAWQEYLELWRIPIEPGTALHGEVPEADGLDWVAALAVALEHRPLLAQARYDIDSAEVALKQASSARLPQLDVNFEARSNGFNPESEEAIEDTVGFEFPTYTAGLSFSMPLLNREAANRERRARVDLVKAKLQYEAQENQIIADVRAAVRSVRYQSEAVRAARASRELAERQLEAEDQAFREGSSTTFQVLEFQRQLAEALQSEKLAQCEYQKAEVALRRAQGRLSDQVLESASAPLPVDVTPAEERE
ncbi:MAG: TolC family protein, partial [Planctomycetota bacterium]